MKKELIKIADIENEMKLELERNQQNGVHLNTNNLVLTLFLKGREENFKLRILKHSKQNLLNGGIYNENRNCYYPSGNSNKDIAEYNKLEKLFKKWGFKKL